jgi:hypothetical protein
VNIPSADFVQVNGLLSLFQFLLYSPMALTNALTLPQLPRLILLFVISANHRSTKCSHDECLGIKGV